MKIQCIALLPTLISTPICFLTFSPKMSGPRQAIICAHIASSSSSIPSPAMRRIPQQIPDAVGRLLKSQHLKIQPTWYAAVMANPPPTLPPNKSRNRSKPRVNDPSTSESGKSQWGERTKRDPRRIKFLEDRIRRQFFLDFPFEAMRPTSLVEMREIHEEHGPQGKQWMFLRQRGAYPTVEK